MDGVLDLVQCAHLWQIICLYLACLVDLTYLPSDVTGVVAKLTMESHSKNKHIFSGACERATRTSPQSHWGLKMTFLDRYSAIRSILCYFTRYLYCSKLARLCRYSDGGWILWGQTSAQPICVFRHSRFAWSSTQWKSNSDVSRHLRKMENDNKLDWQGGPSTLHLLMQMSQLESSTHFLLVPSAWWEFEQGTRWGNHVGIVLCKEGPNLVSNFRSQKGLVEFVMVEWDTMRSNSLWRMNLSLETVEYTRYPQ